MLGLAGATGLAVGGMVKGNIWVRLLKGIGIAFVVLLILAGIARVFDGPEKVEFGEGEVALDLDERDSLEDQARDVMRQYIEQAGFTDEVADCLTEETAKLSDAELSRLESAQEVSEAAGGRAAIPLLRRFANRCIPNVGAVYTSDPTENQLALMRESAKRQLPAVLAEIGVPAAIRGCVVGKVDALSDEELVEMANETTRANVRRFAGYVRACR